MDATISLLAANGEARTTMTAVCAEAGLTERYFYESFGSRDELLVAALDSVSEELAGTALDAIAASSGEPSDRVRATIGAVVDLVVAAPDKMRVAVVESNANASMRARRHELLGSFAALVAAEAREIFGDETWPEPRDHLHGDDLHRRPVGAGGLVAARRDRAVTRRPRHHRQRLARRPDASFLGRVAPGSAEHLDVEVHRSEIGDGVLGGPTSLGAA